MNHVNTGISAVVLSVILTTTSFAQIEVEVRLNVTADDELTAKLDQCLKERLMAFPGVEVEESAEVQLRLIALEQKSATGVPFGYLFYQAGLVPSDTPTAYSVLWETLRSLPPDLPAACGRLASDFHAEVIVPLREGVELFREQLRARAPSPG